MTTSPALLAVAHGTRDLAGQAAIEKLVARVRALAPQLRVGLAYVDDASPSPAHALAELVAAGVTDAVVLPLLLTAGSHTKGDIPGSVQAARVTHPELRLRYGRPFGAHPALLEAARQRLAEVGVHADEPETAVILAAAGAADPDANAEVARVARLLWEGTTWSSVEPAFASATRPTVEQALDRLVRLGARRIAVCRYFLAPGYFADKVAAAARDATGVEVVVAPVLADADPVARLVLERYDEALHGDIRMNCDTCLYRTPVGGRADAVGLVQTPHPHPDDHA